MKDLIEKYLIVACIMAAGWFMGGQYGLGAGCLIGAFYLANSKK